MYILVESRAAVIDAFAAQFCREGVAMTGMAPSAFHSWLEGVTKSELATIDGFLVGDAGDRASLARALKARNARAVIVLNDFNSLEQTLDLFANGVDDVVRKPIHVREILARVRAIQCRAEPTCGSLRIGAMRIHFDGRDPEINGVVLPLPRRERRILEVLAAQRGRRVTKNQLFQSIYGIFDEVVEESVVESHVSKLRKKLRARIGFDPVDSKRYLGYCLVDSKFELNDLDRDGAKDGEGAFEGAFSSRRTRAPAEAYA